MLGRVFNGLGAPIDGGPPQKCDLQIDVNGMAINPTTIRPGKTTPAIQGSK